MDCIETMEINGVVSIESWMGVLFQANWNFLDAISFVIILTENLEKFHAAEAPVIV